MKTVRSIEGTDVPILGSMVTWSGFKDTPRDGLLAALGERMIGTGPLPLSLSLNDKVRRALELAFPMRSRDPGSWEVKALPMVRGTPARFAVIRHAMSDAGTLAVDAAATVEVWANGSEAMVTGQQPSMGFVKALVAEKLAFASANFLARDVRALVTDVILRAARGFPLRDGGGVYLVVAEKLELVTALDAALVAAGAGQLTRFDIVDDEKARATAKIAAEENLRGMVESVGKEIFALRDGQRRRESSILQRAAEAEELRERAAFLKAVLGVQLEEVDAAINECASVVAKLKADAEGGAR